MPNGIRTRNHRSGFTLIELLVVIGIICILLGILLPVVSAMNKKKQQTDTAAEVTRMAVAIQNYYQDFRAYPGPVPESQIWGNNSTGTSTPSGPPVTGLTGITNLTSTENMVLGLLGGLTAPTSATATTFTYSAALVTKGPQSLNYLAPQLINAYYDATSPELSNNGAGTLTSWTTTQGSGYSTPALVVPELMDHFSNPHPILYLRAVVGGTSICDVSSTTTPPGSQYFTGEVTPYWRVYTSTSNLAAPTPPTASKFSTPITANGTDMQYPTALSFFKNASLNDGITPRSKDSFILISAGYDGIYGTSDDVIYSN
jgi:prepilin-type N-terminal cleavage/methylation domain-containing protein